MSQVLAHVETAFAHTNRVARSLTAVREALAAFPGQPVRNECRNTLSGGFVFLYGGILYRTVQVILVKLVTQTTLASSCMPWWTLVNGLNKGLCVVLRRQSYENIVQTLGIR